MLKAFCDVCKKLIEDDEFEAMDIPINGTGRTIIVAYSVDNVMENFHVHTRCVFDSIRAAERRLNEVPAKEAR